MKRRNFLGTLATGLAGITLVPRHVLGGPGYTPPSDKVGLAFVGVGGRGFDHVSSFIEHGTAYIAFCDVDEEQAARAYRMFPKVPRYHDFRKMLDEQGSHIDAVVVATPDHTHAVAAAYAMHRGKHVYVEKPLTRTIGEVRALARLARQTGVVTQMGNQGHAGEGTRRIREWIEAGAIGTVREGHFWTNRPIWPQAQKRPLEAYHIPPTLRWDLWLGPAPERPYHPAYLPFRWRGWWDFGTGALGDMGCHIMDAAFWTFDLRDPRDVVAESTPLFPESPPAATRLTYRYAARGNRPELSVIWRDGSLAPPRPPQLESERPWPLMTNGQMYIGDEGVLIAGPYGGDPRLIPESRHTEWLASAPEARYPRSPGIRQEWLEAIRKGGRAGSDIVNYAASLTEMVLLGNLAIRAQGRIVWDSERMRVRNRALPEDWIQPVYREPWAL